MRTVSINLVEIAYRFGAKRIVRLLFCQFILCVPRARRYAYEKIRDCLLKFFPSKLGIEQMDKVPGQIKKIILISRNPKRPLKEYIGILHNFGTGVKGTKTERPVRFKHITLVLLSGLRSFNPT